MFDSKNWQPTEVATVCYLIKGDEVLLIEKQRGMGTGLVVGPGGRVEKGESIEEGAKRECMEEVKIDVHSFEYGGIIRFTFSSGYKLEGHVYVSRDFSGEPQITDEAIPFWAPLNDLPFDKMWADDILWLSEVLEGQVVDAYFEFDDEKMLHHEVTLRPRS